MTTPLVDRSWSRGNQPREVRTFDDSLAVVRRELGRLAASSERIVVGPWLSEVGFEVLYWIPFLRWAAGEFGLERQRLTAVSRGGTAAWYGGICEHYADVFDGVGVDEFRRYNDERWRTTRGQKQMEFTDFEAKTLDALDLDWDRGRVLHPSLMYELFRSFWRGVRPISAVLDHTTTMRWQPPDDPVVAELPDRYVAVRFYFRPSFPDTPSNRALMHSTIAGLAQRWDVVLLNTDLELDDHVEFDPPSGHRVLRPVASVGASRNLHVQSAIIAGADAFVGTYGGLSYLALAYGVPSIAFASSHRDYVLAHVDVARRTAAATAATLSILDSRTLELAAQLAVGATL